MNNFTKIFIGLEILIPAFIIIALIYLIVRRIRIKETEDFEKRDN